MTASARWARAAMLATVMSHLCWEVWSVVLGQHMPDVLLYGLWDVTMLSIAFSVRTLGPFVYFLGTFLNKLVRFVNGGFMPVLVDKPATMVHIEATEHTRLMFLGDWWRIGPYEASVGDVLLTIGLLITACALVQRGRPS